MTGRCSLCGGRLNNGVCEFCGLNNKMYSREYRKDPYHLSDTEKKPKTHGAPPGQAPMSADRRNRFGTAGRQPVFPSRSQPRKRRDASLWKKSQDIRVRKYKAAALFTIVIVIICATAPVLFQAGRSVVETGSLPDGDSWQTIIDNLFKDDGDLSSDFWDYDLYEFVTREIPETGSTYEASLGSGIYQAGVHIPEGIYRVELLSGNGSLTLSDSENSIYDSAWFGSDEEYDEIEELDDFRLYSGAQISIDGGAVLSFITENAQPLTAEPTANPLTDTLTPAPGTYIVGEDRIPEGIYDIILKDGEGYLSFHLDLIYPDGSSEYLWAFRDSDSPEGRLRNLILPAGTSLTLDGDPVDFVPSEGYFEIDYTQYPWN